MNLVKDRCNMKSRQILFMIALTALLCSCKGRNTSNLVPNPVSPEDRVVSNQVAVDTLRVKNSNIIGNGKVRALRTADMAFAISMPIASVNVVNGQRVRAGQVIATLKSENLQLEVEKARKALESANLRKLDVVVSQGYDPDRLSEVPAEVINLAETKSDYALAQVSIQEATDNLKHAQLKAPFAGVIANLNATVGSFAQAGNPICLVIDDSRMMLEFSINERDLSRVKIGTEVIARPFATPNNVYKGKNLAD